MRHADGANAAGALPFAQRGEVRIGVDEIVDLHQIDAAAELPLGVLHLRDACGAAARPDFRRDEKPVAQAVADRDVTENALGAAVHRGGVDETAAELHEERQNAIERVEGLPRAETDAPYFFSFHIPHSFIAGSYGFAIASFFDCSHDFFAIGQ